MMDSANHVILAAIASRTERIRLGTAVSVLSTQDPVRLYTDFATLDAVSGGRAQLIVGRGSLTDSFPLFGFDLADYEELFEEKLDLLTRLLRQQPVTWSGNFRSPLSTQFVSPPIPVAHDCLALADLAREHTGRVDVLINCAGFFPMHAFEELSLADWDGSSTSDRARSSTALVARRTTSPPRPASSASHARWRARSAATASPSTSSRPA